MYMLHVHVLKLCMYMYMFVYTHMNVYSVLHAPHSRVHVLYMYTCMLYIKGLHAF